MSGKLAGRRVSVVTTGSTLPNQQPPQLRIAFLLDTLSGGGAESVVLNLAGAFAEQGYAVDLLVSRMRGAWLSRLPDQVNLVQLQAVSRWRGVLSAFRADPAAFGIILKLALGLRKLPPAFGYILPIARHLKARPTSVLMAVSPKSNINAVLARELSGAPVRIIVSVHNHISTKVTIKDRAGKTRYRKLLALMRRCYRRADWIVAVSRGVAADVSESLGLARDRVVTVYNPVVSDAIALLSKEPAGHRWLDSAGVPVILGIGRFVPQKDFPLLIRAFARVRQDREVRLVLLGGDQSDECQMQHKQELLTLAAELGIQDHVDFPGFATNPYSFLNRASLFVLASRYEGFGNVLVEALACGCPVVSTDCPSGPAEILDNGRYGKLVPVGDDQRLAAAIMESLDNPPDPDVLRARAREFSVEKAVVRYRQLMFDKPG